MELKTHINPSTEDLHFSGVCDRLSTSDFVMSLHSHLIQRLLDEPKYYKSVISEANQILLQEQVKENQSLREELEKQKIAIVSLKRRLNLS